MTPEPELLVIVPTRGRPEAAAALVSAFAETCGADTALVFAVDDDDDQAAGYAEAVAMNDAKLWINRGAKTMVAALNNAVADIAAHTNAVAFMGDDHRPRTVGWDAKYLTALDRLGTGIVYGNDLLQGERIPTQVAMTGNIVRTLGHMAPPTLRHLFVDNYWRDLGHAAGCLQYLPDVIVEHLHPYAGKAQMDEGYRRVNARDVYIGDAHAYGEYATAHLAADVAKVQALR